MKSLLDMLFGWILAPDTVEYHVKALKRTATKLRDLRNRKLHNARYFQQCMEACDAEAVRAERVAAKFEDLTA